MLKVVVSVATGRDYTEALGGGWLLLTWPPLPLPPSSPSPSVGTFRCAPWKVREVPAQSGLWGGCGTFKALPREVWAERRPRGSLHQGGAARSVLVPSESWQCQVGGQKEAAWVCKLPGVLGGRCIWNPEQLWVRLGSLGAELMRTLEARPGGGRVARRGKGGPDVPGVGCWVRHQESSRGHNEAKLEVPGGEHPGVNLLRVQSHGQLREAPSSPRVGPTTSFQCGQISGPGLGTSTTPTEM